MTNEKKGQLVRDSYPFKCKIEINGTEYDGDIFGEHSMYPIAKTLDGVSFPISWESAYQTLNENAIVHAPKGWKP